MNPNCGTFLDAQLATTDPPQFLTVDDVAAGFDAAANAFAARTPEISASDNVCDCQSRARLCIVAPVASSSHSLTLVQLQFRMCLCEVFHIEFSAEDSARLAQLNEQGQSTPALEASDVRPPRLLLHPHVIPSCRVVLCAKTAVVATCSCLPSQPPLSW